MSVAGDPAARLRALHDAYVWEVNAAIGEGREDLVARLSDQYVREALEALGDELTSPCERPDCSMCGRVPGSPGPGSPARAAPQAVGWRQRVSRWIRRHG